MTQAIVSSKFNNLEEVLLNKNEKVQGAFNNGMDKTTSDFKEIFDKIYNDMNETSKFNTTYNVITKNFCYVSGKLPREYCENDIDGSKIVTGYFKQGAEPNSYCESSHHFNSNKEKHSFLKHKIKFYNNIFE